VFVFPVLHSPEYPRFLQRFAFMRKVRPAWQKTPLRAKGRFYVFLAAAATKDDNRNKNDNPTTAVLATEERIKASHSESSFLLYTMTRRNRW